MRLAQVKEDRETALKISPRTFRHVRIDNRGDGSFVSVTGTGLAIRDSSFTTTVTQEPPKMNPRRNIVPPNSQEDVLRLVQQIQDPLKAIMQANQGVAGQLFGSATKASAITLENSEKIAALIQEIMAQTQGPIGQRPLFFELYRTNLHIQGMCTGKVDEKAISQVDKKWLVDVEQVVFTEPQLDQLSLFGLAFEVAVSERQLHRNIKKFLKLTPNKYVRILKLHKAQQLLREYAYKTIAEVAHAVGFNDPHYFSKQFQNQYGAPPKAFIPV
ncbi:MAG: helix-turn-helix transcriptional regulator [Bacteroidota bacterium]